MKRSVLPAIKTTILTMVLSLAGLVVFAQDKIVIDKDQAESWLSRNWIWLAVGALVLIILLFSGSSRTRRRSSTTVVKDDYGNVKKVTTTEVED